MYTLSFFSQFLRSMNTAWNISAQSNSWRTMQQSLKNMKINVKKIKQPILAHSLSKYKVLRFDTLWAYHPCLGLYRNNFHILYTGKRIKNGIAHQIGIAKSKDLIHWEKYEKNPILLQGKEDAWD